jgi:hypothetical protein
VRYDEIRERDKDLYTRLQKANFSLPLRGTLNFGSRPWPLPGRGGNAILALNHKAPSEETAAP